MQRGGLFGAEHRVGKGTRLIYQPDMLHRVLFCLELAELGVTPAVQLKLVAELWDKRIREIFSKAETVKQPAGGGDDVILLMVGVSLMVEAWTGAVPNINDTTFRKLPSKAALALRRPRRKDDPLLPRVLAVNLSARLRRFHEALSDVHLAFKQPPVGQIQERRAGKIEARRASGRRTKRG